jgi:hypothetical protein
VCARVCVLSALSALLFITNSVRSFFFIFFSGKNKKGERCRRQHQRRYRALIFSPRGELRGGARGR